MSEQNNTVVLGTINRVKPEPKTVTGIHHHPYDFGAALQKKYPGKTIVLGTSNMRLSFQEDFLDKLDLQTASYWNCICCRKFFNKFGSLLALVFERSEDGEISSLEMVPALWHVVEDTPSELIPAYEYLSAKMSDAKWSLPFATNWTKEDIKNGFDAKGALGTLNKGDYEHWHVSTDGISNINVHGASFASVEDKLHTLTLLAQRYLSKFSLEELDKQFARSLTLLDLSSKASAQIGEKALTVKAFKKFLLLSKTHKVSMAAALLTESEFMRIYYLNSSAVGEYLSSLILEERDAEQCVNFFIKMTDPLYYQRAQKEASDADLMRLKEMMEEKGYTDRALTWSLVTPNDDVLIGKFVGEEVASTESNSIIDNVLGTRKEQKVQRDHIDTPKRVTYKDFFENYAHRITSLKVPAGIFSNHGKTTFLILAKMAQREGDKSPLKNAKLANMLYYKHAVPVPFKYFGIDPKDGVDIVGWTEIDDVKFLVVTGTRMPEAAAFPAPLFAESYNGDFYPHRRALEQLMSHVSVGGIVGEEVLYGLPVYREITLTAVIDNVEMPLTLIHVD